MVEDVFAMLNNLGIHQCHLLGHSMGGKTAMHFAAEYPEMVDKLIVVDIAPKSYPDRHSKLLDALMRLPLDQIEKRSDADKFLAKSVNDYEERLFLLKNLKRTNDGFHWKIDLHALYSNYGNINNELPLSDSFDGPTLFIRGSKSPYILETDWDRIQKQFPSATLKTVEGAGHWVHADHPKETDILVREFLNN